MWNCKELILYDDPSKDQYEVFWIELPVVCISG